MHLDEANQPGRGDAGDCSNKRDIKYGVTEVRIVAVVELQTTDDGALSGLRTDGQPMERVYKVLRNSEMPH